MVNESHINRARTLVDASADYIERTLHAAIAFRPWAESAELAPYLTSRYRFMTAELAGVETLWMFALTPERPLAIAKQVGAVSDRFSGSAVVVFQQLSAYARRQLIERGVPFVVPGVQMYLPPAGIDLRPKGAPPREERQQLRPASQLLFLRMLLGPNKAEYRQSTTAVDLGYAVMTVSRAVSELEAAVLAEANRSGQERVFRLAAPRRDVWDRALPVLSSPVKRRVLASELPHGVAAGAPLAGLCALGDYTMLQGPDMRYCAVSIAQAEGVSSIADAADERDLAEVWSYDPRLLSDGRSVDRLSLYLSLRDDPDERVHLALEQLLERVEW